MAIQDIHFNGLSHINLLIGFSSSNTQNISAGRSAYISSNVLECNVLVNLLIMMIASYSCSQPPMEQTIIDMIRKTMRLLIEVIKDDELRKIETERITWGRCKSVPTEIRL